MNLRFDVKRIAYFCIILVLVLLVIVSGLRILESTVFSHQDTTDFTSKVIVRDGVKYFPKQSITVIMVVGIDRFGKVQPSNSYNNDGAADMVSLVIFDEEAETCNVLCLNRDTMLDMPVLGVGGKEAGIVHQQLALAHTYGSGLDDSCRNTKKAVSNFLYGVDIDYYVSMNMDAIGILNDSVGGVSVNVVDDFSGVDDTIPMGPTVLRGQQAIHFVRSRMNMDDQTNLARMKRQEQYMDGFVNAFREKQSSSVSFVVSAYEDVSDYIVTDCTANGFSSLLRQYADYRVEDVISPAGKSVLGEKYFEFHVDEEQLDALILRLFYQRQE